MIKKVPGSGVLSDTTPDLFKRHETMSRFRGYVTFGNGDSSALLEIADTPSLRAKGLMGRKSMPACCGMLFTNLEGGAFWMKGCYIPLDIVFVDTNGTITRKYTMQADGGVRRYAYGDERTAIELPAGFCSNHGVELGSKCEWRTW